MQFYIFLLTLFAAHRGTLLICFNPHLLLLLKGLKLGVSCHDIQFQIYHLQRLQSVSEWAKFL